MEKEVKFLEVNPKIIREKLLAKHFHHEPETMYCFSVMDFPNQTILHQGDLLRVRKEGNTTKITYKRKNYAASETIRQMEETEVEVSDYNETIQILESIGLQKVNRLMYRDWETDRKSVV